MPLLRQPYVNSVVVPGGATSATVPIVINMIDVIWAIEQITCNFSNGNDSSSVAIVQDGYFPTAGALFPSASGLTQTFAGQPYIYLESSNALNVKFSFSLTGGSLGGTALVYVQYRALSIDDEELVGRRYST